MFTHQSDSFRKFAISIGRVRFLKEILRPLYSRYNLFLSNNRNKLFNKYGLSVLKTFDECLSRNGFHYSLAFGSLLGAVREHGFLKHDLDMDVVMWNEDYSPRIKQCLVDAGFRLLREITVDGGDSGREETFEKNGVDIDIFYIYPAIDDFPYYCDFIACNGSVSFEDSMKKNGYIIARRLQMPWIKQFKKVKFETLELPIVTNAEEILSFRYGKDYMTPNPKWHYDDMNDNTIIWQEKKAIVKSY